MTSKVIRLKSAIFSQIVHIGNARREPEESLTCLFLVLTWLLNEFVGCASVRADEAQFEHVITLLDLIYVN